MTYILVFFKVESVVLAICSQRDAPLTSALRLTETTPLHKFLAHCSHSANALSVSWLEGVVVPQGHQQ